MNKSKCLKECAAIFLGTILFFVLLLAEAKAAVNWPSVSASAYCEFYAAKTIYVYQDSACKTRGTCSPAQSYKASISKDDECYVYEFTNNYLKVNYPTYSGRKTGYIKRTDFVVNTSISSPTMLSKANGKVTTFKTAGGKAYGSTASGDDIYALGENNGFVAIIYSARSKNRAFKYGFVTKADYDKITTEARPNPQPSADPDRGKAGTYIIPNGWYMIVCGNSDDRILDIYDRNKDNGGNLIIYQKYNAKNQRFYLEYQNNGFYAIRCLDSGKYLHVACGDDFSSNVHQWEGKGHNNAQWSITSAGGDYYYFQNRSTGSYLDNSNQSTNLANNVIVYPFNGSPAQKWKLLSTSDASDEKRTLSDGWYEVQCGNNNSFVWDINAGINNGKNDGANLEIYPRHGGENQQFYLKYLDNGYYAIMAKHSNKYLHKQDSGTTENVLQWGGYHKDATQTQWAISSAGNGSYFVRAKAGNYADNCGARVANGNSVITHWFNGSDAQKWKFVSLQEEASTLSISGASNPGTLNQGAGFTCKGTITSNYNIEQVTVGIWDANNNEVTVTSRTPNAKSYDIQNLDADVHFSYAKPGRNHYEVWARDAKQTLCLVDVWYDVKEVDGLVSIEEIDRAASAYGIANTTNAYKALLSINTKYGEKLKSNASGTNVFLFEGVGNYSSTKKHANAMCVVLKERKIVYLNRNCTTLPDLPFSATSHPTIMKGVYNFITVRHHPSGALSNYAALKICSDKNGAIPVLRFKSKKSFYESTSEAINVHARWSYSLSTNSEGCQLIGAPGFSSSKKSTYPNEYLAFCKAVGILKQNRTSMTYTTNYDNSVTGKIVIDRSYAEDYLKKVGYPESALGYLR